MAISSSAVSPGVATPFYPRGVHESLLTMLLGSTCNLAKTPPFKPVLQCNLCQYASKVLCGLFHVEACVTVFCIDYVPIYLYKLWMLPLNYMRDNLKHMKQFKYITIATKV
jgi:hypothetical protein